MKKILGILLILAGLIFVLSPFITDKVVSHYSSLASSQELSGEELEKNRNSGGEEFDFSAVEDVDIRSMLAGSKNFNKDNIIGTLIIPDLNLDLPIMKGLSDSNLMAGIATMKPGQEFGQANFALAGHNMKNKDLLFGSLMDIQPGSKAYVSDGVKIYEYKIMENKVVEDTALYMIEDEEAQKAGVPILSLMTCYHTSKSGKRFFSIGYLVDQYNIK